MKIRTVGAELFHAGGRTDRPNNMTKLAFCEDVVRLPVYGLEYGLNIWSDFLKLISGVLLQKVFEEVAVGENHLHESDDCYWQHPIDLYISVTVRDLQVSMKTEIKTIILFYCILK